jgi:hypothetical protein
MWTGFMWLKIRITGWSHEILSQVLTNVAWYNKVLWSWKIHIVGGVARFLGTQDEESQWPPIKEMINFKKSD